MGVEMFVPEGNTQKPLCLRLRINHTLFDEAVCVYVCVYSVITTPQSLRFSSSSTSSSSSPSLCVRECVLSMSRWCVFVCVMSPWSSLTPMAFCRASRLWALTYTPTFTEGCKRLSSSSFSHACNTTVHNTHDLRPWDTFWWKEKSCAFAA